MSEDSTSQPSSTASTDKQTSSTAITDKQKSRLDILALVQNDNAAGKAAIDFIQDDPLKLELFKRQYDLTQAETTVLSRTIKAVSLAKESLNLFN